LFSSQEWEWGAFGDASVEEGNASRVEASALRDFFFFFVTLKPRVE